MRSFTLLAFLSILAVDLCAAKLTLRDGNVMYGQFVSGTSRSIVFQDDRGARHEFDVDRIQNIDFGPDNRPSANISQPENRQPQLGQSDADRIGEPRAGGDWAVIPRGTEVLVRTDEDIHSENAATGRTYRATIIGDVMDDRGGVAIPRGSEAQLMIRVVTPGGNASDGSFLLDLDSVRVNGRWYQVSTADIEPKNENAIGKNRRTGEMVGGGAVLGTLLGAIAGGGKGAAIGAVAGAAAGGGAQILTKGHEVRVPVEAVLHFRLDQPLRLKEMR